MKLKQTKEKGMNLMTYKKGELVRVKLGLKDGSVYGNMKALKDMTANNGKVMRVYETDGLCFRLNDSYWYSNEMLEPIDNLSAGDTVRVREDIGSLKDEPPGITRSMKEIAGNIAHIDSTCLESGNTYIGLAGSVTSWLPQWLDKVEECKNAEREPALKKKFNINNYKGYYSMLCKNQEEAKVFCSYLNSIGRKWRAGNSYLDQTYFYEEDDKMYYEFNDGRCTKNDYCGDNVLNFSDFDWNTTEYELKQDKNTTVLLKKLNGKVVNRGVAKCMETDEFNETFGIIMAAIKLANDSRDKLTVEQANELQQAIENLAPQKNFEELNESLTKKYIELINEVFK